MSVLIKRSPKRCAWPNSAPASVYSSPSRTLWPVDRLHEIARQGRLAEHYATAGQNERQLMTTAAYEVVWPIVFARVTRRFEQRRGHTACSMGIERLSDECLDRFHNDVEAVVRDLFTHARLPVHNLEGWVTGRLTAATVNGHRRLRGERGALQRPRLPAWLGAELAQDRWLCTLAVEILIWVGIEDAASAAIWPLDGWAQRRGTVTGDWRRSEPAVVTREIETVLAAMRKQPGWYASYVERPLGRKQALPVDTTGDEHPPVLTDPYQHIDAEMLRLAADAVAAIDRRISSGEEARRVVVDVIRTVFGRTVTIAGLDRAPHVVADPALGLTGALADFATVERIVATVLEIIETLRSGRCFPAR